MTGKTQAPSPPKRAEAGRSGARRILPFIKRGWRFAWKLAIVALLAGLVIYRLRFAPVPVNSRQAAVGPIVSEVMGTGTLEARYSAIISPKITGTITQVLVDQSDHIAKGQLLATLYDGDLRQQVAMAKADLAAAQAAVDRAAADIVSAHASAVQARASYARYVQLAQTGSVSKEDVDKATRQRDMADAQLKSAQLAKVEAERQVLKAQEAVRYYQEQLDYTRITSPFDGLVIRRSMEAGDVAVPGSEILQIISTGQIWVSAWVDETAMASVSPGQPARIVFRSEPGRSYAGVVTRLAPSVDQETREFLVDVTAKKLPGTWAIGQRAEVYIQTAEKDRALLAPAAAIVWRNGKPGLFVSNAGHARWRNVILGLRGQENVEITGGLSAGEIIIWPRDPQAEALIDGHAVRVR